MKEIVIFVILAAAISYGAIWLLNGNHEGVLRGNVQDNERDE